MITRTFSFVVCAILASACAGDAPTGPTTDFIAIDSMVPAAGTTLVAGERVTFTATITCTIVTADGGFAAFVLQDQRNQSLRDGDTLAPEATLRKGTATHTFTQTITVPESGSTVNALFPLFVTGSDSTRAVAVRTYAVR
jgi:hypothetical protein